MDLKFLILIVATFLASGLCSSAAVYFLAPIALQPLLANGGGHGGGSGEGEEHGGGEESHAPNETIGMNLELDEFTVNLKSDPAVGGNQFLRTKMSLSVTVPEAEYCPSLGEHHAMVIPASAKATQVASLPADVLYNRQFNGKTVAFSGHHAVSTSGFMSQSKTGTIAGAAASIDNNQPDKNLIAEGHGGPDPETLCNMNFNKKMGNFVPTIRDIVNAALMKRTASSLASIEGQEALKDEIVEQLNEVMPEEYPIIRVNFSDFIIQY